MNADELRATQAPLKARYRDAPASALLTMRAKGRVSRSSLSFTLETGRSGVPAALHPFAGGDGSGACPADILLEALAGCDLGDARRGGHVDGHHARRRDGDGRG